jgi:hypothetical protein
MPDTSPPVQRMRRQMRGIGVAAPCTTACTRACTSERPPRSFPVIVRLLAPIRPSPPASEELAESSGFVNEKPPVSSCDIGGRQSGRGGSNSRHSAWEADVLPLNYARGFTIVPGCRQQAYLPSEPPLGLGPDCPARLTGISPTPLSGESHPAVRVCTAARPAACPAASLSGCSAAPEQPKAASVRGIHALKAAWTHARVPAKRPLRRARVRYRHRDIGGDARRSAAGIRR